MPSESLKPASVSKNVDADLSKAAKGLKTDPNAKSPADVPVTEREKAPKPSPVSSRDAGLALVDALARGETSSLDARQKELLKMISKDKNLVRKLAKAVKERKRKLGVSTVKVSGDTDAMDTKPSPEEGKLVAVSQPARAPMPPPIETKPLTLESVSAGLHPDIAIQFEKLREARD